MDQYGEPLFAPNGSEEERLFLMDEVFDPMSIAALSGLGVGRRARCLEVGSGGGSMARWFCSRASEGEVVTTGLGGPLPEEPRSFDVIHARFEPGQLPVREGVMRRMTEWLRPGGFLLVESFSWIPSHGSPNPLYQYVMRRWSDLVLHDKGRGSGRPGDFPGVRYGLRHPGAESVVRHFQGGGPIAEFWRLTIDLSRERLLGDGHLTEPELEQTYGLLRNPRFWDAAPALTQAWGYR
ncbi:hypothetical protein [Streptomyces luteireticuli]|uniref:hypothetical protein n=1 Tax=Streptomyces luteireticuli TaxID=173858 RepID=UPI0035590102